MIRLKHWHAFSGLLGTNQMFPIMEEDSSSVQVFGIFFGDELVEIQLVCCTTDKQGGGKRHFEKKVCTFTVKLLQYRNEKCVVLLSFTFVLHKPFGCKTINTNQVCNIGWYVS